MKKGFTVIELLVVMAIIGILVAIVVTNVSSYIQKQKHSEEMGQSLLKGN